MIGVRSPMPELGIWYQEKIKREIDQAYYSAAIGESGLSE